MLIDAAGAVEVGEVLGTDTAVMAEALDAEQASIGGKAERFELIEVAQPSADVEIVVSLMVVSVRNARPCLWYCLIRECL